MKQYTTQTQTINVPGQENLLLIADRIVVAAESSSGNLVTWEGDRLTVEGESVTWRMTADETAALLGKSKVEVTIFSGSDVYKTETKAMEVKRSVWDNGAADD